MTELAYWKSNLNLIVLKKKWIATNVTRRLKSKRWSLSYILYRGHRRLGYNFRWEGSLLEKNLHKSSRDLPFELKNLDIDSSITNMTAEFKTLNFREELILQYECLRGKQIWKNLFYRNYRAGCKLIDAISMRLHLEYQQRKWSVTVLVSSWGIKILLKERVPTVSPLKKDKVRFKWWAHDISITAVGGKRLNW